MTCSLSSVEDMEVLARNDVPWPRTGCPLQESSVVSDKPLCKAKQTYSLYLKQEVMGRLGDSAD